MATSCVITRDGLRYWRDAEGDLHRGHGPAAEYPNGAKAWYQHGVCHRKNGPAIVLADGSEMWYSLGRIHRPGGRPAIEYGSGYKEWFEDGKLVRAEWK